MVFSFSACKSRSYKCQSIRKLNIINLKNLFFGIVNPEPKQVLKDLLIEDGKLIDYLIGKKTLFSNYIIIVYLPITACLF